MIFTILISIVFVAELIIAFTVFSALRRWSKKVNELNLTLSYLKPSIKDICELTRKISEQLVEFSERFVEKINSKGEELVIRQISRMVLSAFLFKKYTNLLVRDTNLIAKLLNLIINTKLFCLILTKKMVLR